LHQSSQLAPKFPTCTKVLSLKSTLGHVLISMEKHIDNAENLSSTHLPTYKSQFFKGG
jgi:hypothetical protein